MTTQPNAIPLAKMSDVSAVVTLRAGRLHCTRCDRSFHKLEALRDHAQMLHGGDYADILRKLVKQDRRDQVIEARRQEASEKQAAAQRAARRITFDAAYVDEIVGQLNMLIGCMEPYYAGSTASDDAEAMIKHLTALADGTTPAEAI